MFTTKNELKLLYRFCALLWINMIRYECDLFYWCKDKMTICKTEKKSKTMSE